MPAHVWHYGQICGPIGGSCPTKSNEPALILCEKFIGPLTLSKDVLRDERMTWLIKCSGEENLNNVGHFNRLNKFLFYIYIYIYIYGGASFNFSSYCQEAMECVDDQLLHDKEGTNIKEEVDHGHELI